MKNISRFLEPLKFNKIYSLTVFLEFLFWSMLWIIAIFFIRDITQVLEFGTRQDFFFVLKKYSLLFFALMICSHLIRNYGWVRFLENIRNTLYKKYLPAFIKLDNTFIEKQGTGKLNHLLQQGINAHSIMLNDTLYNIAKMVPFILITLYFVFQVYFLLGMLFIILYIGLLFYTKYFDDKQVKIRRKKHILKKNISQIVAKIIMSKFEILQSGKVQGEGDKIDELFKKIIQNNREQNFWGHILFRGSEIILFISKILVLYFIGEQYFFGDVSLTFVVTFMTVLLYFEKNSQDFLIFYKNITRDIHEMTGLWNFFDTTPQIQGYEEGKIFQHKSGQISLKKINYSYDASKPVFQNFSLEIPGNRVTALVGPSGGGKSTLVKLISGYIRQDSGDILVDEQNLKSVSLKSYYKDVGYLTQEPSVFDGTVEENLMYAVDNSLCPSDISLDEGDKKSSPSSSGKPAKHVGELQERLERTIKLAHCDFIYDLPNGLKTEIGERGVKLSGGQKQRLAIAKIFLKNPKIIILDEPTSALDSLSEQKITEAMHNLFKNRTVLVIAHRLQTVKHADEIIVIEGGEIRERGTHKSLVKKKGFYKQMLDLQSGF